MLSLSRLRRRPAAPRLVLHPVLEGELPTVHNQLIADGYVLAPAGVAEVTVTVGGHTHVADTGLASPRAAAAHPRVRGSSRSGFRAVVDTSELAPGPAEMTVRAVDRAGRETSMRKTVDVRPFRSPPPTFAELEALARAGDTALCLETPAHDSRLAPGYFAVRGWAHCAAGLERVVVTLGSQSQTLANRNLPRPDLGPGNDVDLTGAGFEARVDARGLEPGEHWMSVVAIGPEGPAMGVELRLLITGGEFPSLLPPPLPEPAGTSSEAVLIGTPPGPAAPGDPRPEWRAGDPAAPHARGALFAAERRLRGELVEALSGDQHVTSIPAAAGGDDEAAPSLSRLPLPLPDGGLPVVACLDPIELCADPESALAELERVLAPDGLLVVVVAREPGLLPPVSRGAGFDPLPGLRERFPHVEVFEQATAAATVIRAAGDDAEPRVSAPDRTSVPTLYAVLAASHRPIRRAPALASLTDAGPDIAGWHRLAEAWEDRARWAHAHADASRNAAAEAWIRSDHLDTELAATRGSLSWRLTRPLRALKRIASR